MVHSSYVKRLEYTTPTGEVTTLAPRPDNALELFDQSYETLEHLGDSILGATISTYLLKRFPQENEGFLTDLKKDIVCNEMLGYLSQKIGLDKFYIISRHNEDVCAGRTNTKKLGDILEAFIGALWTDSGNDFQVVSSFLIAIVEIYINIPKLLMNNRNFKEQLQKFYQAKFHHTPKYVMLSSAANMYTMAAVDEKGIHIGIGSAPTKKQAEQLAAKEAMNRLT
jgi:ribonuclease-3